MRIALLSYGSRGDAQPFGGLALGLQEAGHSMRLGLLRPGILALYLHKASRHCPVRLAAMGFQSYGMRGRGS
jgi:hypothetical protein